MHLKMSSGKWQPFCLGLNVLIHASKRSPSCLMTPILLQLAILLHHFVISHTAWFCIKFETDWITEAKAGSKYDFAWSELTHWGPGKFPAISQIFKCIFLNENVLISLKISLKFVPNISINNIPALVQIMVWCQLGDKPLSEPMMVSLQTHMCHSASMSYHPTSNISGTLVGNIIVENSDVVGASLWCNLY